MRIPASLLKGAKLLEMPFYSESFKKAKGYQDFVSAKGAPFEGRIEAASGPVDMVYQVALTHAQAAPRHGLDEVPHKTSKGWMLVGRAFLPVLKRDGQRWSVPTLLKIDAPQGVVSSAGRAQGPAQVGSLSDLSDAFYYLGPHESITVTRGQTTVRIMSADFSAEALAPLKTLVDKTLSTAEASLGPAPKKERFLIFDRQSLGFAGGVIGGDITLMSSTPPTASALAPIGAVVVHELGHLWVHADAPWLSEGFNSYFELMWGLRIDGASPRAGLDALMRLHTRYQANRKPQPIAKAKGLAAYTDGAMLAFCLDAELRQKNHTLIEVFKAALGGSPGTTVADLKAAVKAADPQSAAYLEAVLNSPDGVDFDGCLKSAGLTSKTESFKAFSLRDLVVSVLKITGFSPQQAQVFRIKPDSVLKVGDVIQSVDGAPIKLIPEVNWALRDKKPGQKVQLKVLRDGAVQELELVVPKVERSKTEKRISAEFMNPKAERFFKP